MKRKDLESLLKNEIESNVPFVLPNAIKANVTPEIYKEKQNNKKNEKPYFRFRYLYVTLCMFAVLMVGLGIFLPDINNRFLADNSQSQTENYIVDSTLYVGDYRAKVTSNSSNVVSSIKIYVDSSLLENVNLTNINNVKSAYNYIVNYLNEEEAFVVTEAEFSVHSTKSENDDAIYNSLIISVEQSFSLYGLNLNIVRR